MNMSKFVAEDVPLFLALIDDLFPNDKAERTQFEDVTTALTKVWSSLAHSSLSTVSQCYVCARQYQFITLCTVTACL